MTGDGRSGGIDRLRLGEDVVDDLGDIATQLHGLVEAIPVAVVVLAVDVIGVHVAERAVEERVDVVAIAGPARVFHRREAAADRVAALEAQRLEPGAPEISLEDEAVVPRPQEDAVVRLSPP